MWRGIGRENQEAEVTSLTLTKPRAPFVMAAQPKEGRR
jgi:hypothetical protein